VDIVADPNEAEKPDIILLHEGFEVVIDMLTKPILLDD
jgi:hypothetical protein